MRTRRHCAVSFIDQSDSEQIKSLKNLNENPNPNVKNQYSDERTSNQKNNYQLQQRKGYLGKRSQLESDDAKEDCSDQLTTSNSVPPEAKIRNGSGSRQAKKAPQRREYAESDREDLKYFEQYWVYFHCYNCKNGSRTNFYEVQLDYFIQKTQQHRAATFTPEKNKALLLKEEQQKSLGFEIPEYVGNRTNWSQQNFDWAFREAKRLYCFKHKRGQQKQPRLKQYVECISKLAEKKMLPFDLPKVPTIPNQAVEKIMSEILLLFFFDTTFMPVSDLHRRELPQGYLIKLEEPNILGHFHEINPDYDLVGQLDLATKVTFEVHQFLSAFKDSQLPTEATADWPLKTPGSCSDPPSLHHKIMIGDTCKCPLVQDIKRDCSLIMAQHQMEMGELKRLISNVITNYGLLDNHSDSNMLTLMIKASYRCLLMCYNQVTYSKNALKNLCQLGKANPWHFLPRPGQI